MMIKTISLKNIASYDSYGIQLNDLKKINFIYGSNGSGKTTISNFIDSIENTAFSSCSVEWVDDHEINRLVYNKQFRDRNFGKSTIEGVFTLGEATKEDLDRIEECKLEQQKIKNEGAKKRQNLNDTIDNKEKIELDFKSYAWTDIYKKYEPFFKEAFKGFMQKESFKNKILTENVTSYTAREYEYLIEKSKTVFGERPERILPINNIAFDRITELEKEGIWETKIIGKADVDIAKLIQNLNINDWVNKGRDYIQDSAICPFCQQSTITDTFRSKLESYFDDTYPSSIKHIANLNEKYNIFTKDILEKLTAIEASEKSNKESKLDTDNFSTYLHSLSSTFIANKERLDKKINEPSRTISLLSTESDLNKIKDLISSANDEIQKNNEIVLNYNNERADLINEIWSFIINKFAHSIKSIKGQKTSLDKSIDTYRKLGKEIQELSKNVTSIEPTIIEINTALEKFGFLNFKIVPSESEPNHYQLQRENGELAESTLSEGEVTFITFLYFLQLAKGSTDEDSISEERILVVDDPISSLDSTILFIVSTLLKEIIKDIKSNKGNIKQLILLTHNVYFHKEVSFIDGRTKESKETNYWIIRKNSMVSTIQPFEMKNPIQTSYDLLWQEIRNREHNSSITIQNTMRRIIENYFKILGKYRDDDLIQNFETKEEQEICRSLLCWINDGSHSISDDLFIESQEDSIEKYLCVFKDIFVYTDHAGHYNMMMESN